MISLNNKIAVLLEEKLWNIKSCVPSDNLTNKFMEILEMLPESRQIIIKMRYGLNDEDYKYKWNDILTEINKIYGDYPCTMHRIKEMERKAWGKIDSSLIISPFDIACNELFNLSNKDK